MLVHPQTRPRLWINGLQCAAAAPAIPPPLRVRGGQRAVWLVMGEHGVLEHVRHRLNQIKPVNVSPVETLPRSPTADRSLWRSERITLSAAACGFFRHRRVKVFVNTAAHEEITLHLPLLAEHLCVTVRQQGQSMCQSGARSTVSGSRPSVGVPPADIRAVGAATQGSCAAIFGLVMAIYFYQKALPSTFVTISLLQMVGWYSVLF